ncbi:MAG: hypothetical protein LBS21_10515, partial [Clostridiales bacterium]|nr:hypothetical protein [Clostridiales bacterium]
AFVESVNQKGGIRNSEAPDTMLQKWLTVITQNEIADKTIIQNICEQEEEIGMVVSELARLSEDTVVRQQYQSRQEFIMLYNKRINDLKSGIEMADQMTEIANQMVEKEMRRAEKEMRRAEKESQRAEKESKRAEKESKRAEKAETAVIASRSAADRQNLHPAYLWQTAL